MSIEQYLEEKIEAKEIIEVKYNGGSKPGTFRKLMPLSIATNKLIAIDIQSEKRKYYMLAKIEIPGQKLTRPEDNNPTLSKIKGKEDLGIFYNHFLEKNKELGWHTQFNKEDYYIALSTYYKNGKLKKPYIQFYFREFTTHYYWDNEGKQREEVEPSRFPWVVYSKYADGSHYGILERALKKFLELAIKHAPVNQTPDSLTPTQEANKKRQPTEKQIKQLKFFKIKNIKNLNRYEAGEQIKELLKNEDNKKKWNGRPPDKEQKEILDFFKVEHKTLTFPEAKEIINDLLDNEENSDEWYAHLDHLDDLEAAEQERLDAIEEAKEERKYWFEDNRELYNMDSHRYGCKKLNKKIFRETIEALESEGNTLKQLEEYDFYPIVFQRALEKYPELALKHAPVNQAPDSLTPTQEANKNNNQRN